MTAVNKFHVGLVGLIVLAAVLFWFSSTSENGKPGVTRELAPPRAISVTAPVQKVETPAAIDYSKILGKYKGRDVTRAATDEKIIALTFDGGGNADGAQKIFDVLKQNNVPAAFFLTGKFTEKFPETAGKIKKSGWEVGNHTYSHKNLAELSVEETVREISGLKETAPFFRFPYGAYKKDDIKLVNDLGYVAVRWTVDSLGWQGKRDGRDARFVADRVINGAVPGGIVLMHLGSAADGSMLDADALADIIETLRAQEYQFATLSELFASTL